MHCSGLLACLKSQIKPFPETYTPTRSSSGTRTSRFSTQSLRDSSVVPYPLSSPDCCGGTTYSSDFARLVFTG